MSTPISTGVFPIERSDYYQMWLEEREAIAVHKYYLSEKAGRDVGCEFARWNWVMAGHRARWLTARKSGIA